VPLSAAQKALRRRRFGAACGKKPGQGGGSGGQGERLAI